MDQRDEVLENSCLICSLLRVSRPVIARMNEDGLVYRQNSDR